VAIHLTVSGCKLSSIALREFRAAAVELQHRVAFFEVDASAEPELLAALNIKAVPALLVFHSGTEQLALLGFYYKNELRERLLRSISTGEQG